MELRTQVTLILTAAVAVWALTLIASGQELALQLLSPFGFTISLVTGLAILFVKFAWKWRVFRNWLVKRPNLAGTWRARLVSTYKDSNGERVEKQAYMVIAQDLLTLSIRLYTSQARSHSLSQNIRKGEDELFDVAVVYLNVPKVELRGIQSEIHHGALLLSHVATDQLPIEGDYWTDRKTSGSISLLERRPKLATSFESAERLFSS